MFTANPRATKLRKYAQCWVQNTTNSTLKKRLVVPGLTEYYSGVQGRRRLVKMKSCPKMEDFRKLSKIVTARFGIVLRAQEELGVPPGICFGVWDVFSKKHLKHIFAIFSARGPTPRCSEPAKWSKSVKSRKKREIWSGFSKKIIKNIFFGKLF